MKYNPALDGVRAVAIILVFGVHFADAALPGGWIGVDIFFVLSGYLITTILLTEMNETGRISLGNFYIRRILRLMPPLALVCLATFAISLFSPQGAEIRQATWVALLYLENWIPTPNNVMAHTWSLATEEQFYLLWPLLLPLVFGRRPLTILVAAIGLTTIAKLGLWLAGASQWWFVYSLPIRPVGLLVGCALAFLPTQPRFLSLVKPGYLLAALILIAVFDSSDNIWTPILASLLTAALIACLQDPNSAPYYLTAAPVRYIGKISYGLYLYHWPIRYFGTGHMPKLVLIGLVVAVAALSYKFVEKPFLRLKDAIRPRSPLPQTASSRRPASALPPSRGEAQNAGGGAL